MMKRLLPLVALVLPFCIPGSAAAAGAPPSPPNVVIIFCDDMGYADIAPFGAKYATPNLDRMAR
jgi:arylsulfatase A